ncbi:MAG TPA: hypothetical protein VM142_03695 [Acidimicrobiales bacterium]|nr:hypothetical protein [Acidimicrobiales bacterium]
MRFPSATAYMEALQDPAFCFADPELAAGSAALTAIGLPKALSGNVATVFRVDCPTGRSYAVRCFIRSFDDEQQRYSAIGAHLDRLAPSWRVGFELQPEGILVEGVQWPMLKMEWTSGESLTSYLEANLWNSPAIAYMAQRLAELSWELREAGVAHGDLQHGNILVSPGGALRLIDYDGMFVPGLEGMSSNERGHRNYQHPGRTQRDFGPHLDHFSSWIIYTSLVAVATDPLLWGRLDGGDECLLFRHEDLEDPAGSRTFAALAASGDETLVSLANLLRSFLDRDIAAVPPLSPGKAPQPSLARGQASGVHPEELAEKQALYTALRGTAPAAAPAGPEARASEEAVRAHEERSAPAAHPFEGRLTLPRTALRAALGLVVLIVLITAVGVVPPALGVLALLLVGGGVLAMGNQVYKALPEVAAARGAEEELGRRQAAASAAQRVVDNLAAERAAVDSEEASARDRAAREAEELKRKEGAELRAVEDELRATLSALTAKEQSSYKAEREALATALVDVRQARMDEELTRRPLATASGRGVSDQVLYGLALDGIRTAADFVDVEVRDKAAVVIAADGREVRVAAIGPREAQSIMAWRRSIEDSVAVLHPNKISPEREREIRAHFNALRESLAEQEAPARAAASAVAAEVAVKYVPRHEQVGIDLKAREAEAVRRRIQLDQQLAKARKDAAEAQWRVRSFEREAAAYRELTLLRFLRQLTWD